MLSQKERNRKSYLKAKENGLCQRCGKQLDRCGCYCVECLKKVNEYNREARKFYQSIKICPVCRKNRLYGDERSCDDCKTKRFNRTPPTEEQKTRYKESFLARQKALYVQREKDGLCTRCGKRIAAPEKKKCALCLAKDAEYHRRKTESEKEKQMKEE